MTIRKLPTSPKRPVRGTKIVINPTISSVPIIKGAICATMYDTSGMSVRSPSNAALRSVFKNIAASEPREKTAKTQEEPSLKAWRAIAVRMKKKCVAVRVAYSNLRASMGEERDVTRYWAVRAPIRGNEKVSSRPENARVSFRIETNLRRLEVHTE